MKLSDKDFGPAFFDLMQKGLDGEVISKNKAARLLDMSPTRIGTMCEQKNATLELMETIAKLWSTTPLYFKPYRAELLKRAYLKGGKKGLLKQLDEFDKNNG